MLLPDRLIPKPQTRQTRKEAPHNPKPQTLNYAQISKALKPGKKHIPLTTLNPKRTGEPYLSTYPSKPYTLPKPTVELKTPNSLEPQTLDP